MQGASVGLTLRQTEQQLAQACLRLRGRSLCSGKWPRRSPGVEVLPLDTADESAPSKVFGVLKPDILILCAGAFPPAAPLHEQSWQQFAVNWETDVKIALHFCKAALSEPLPGGASVILISSGAALAGSPNLGGYAGAKRTQLFIANYSQKESDRLGLGLRFSAVAPRIMPAKPRRS